MNFIAFIKKYSHCLWALFLPVYLFIFFAVEHFITENYWNTALPLDSMVPFIKEFVIAYCLWYPAMAAVGIFLLIKDIPAFRRYMWFIIVGFSMSLLICAVIPNGQDLRPEQLANDDLFSRLIADIYRVDTNTNVLPSVHIVGSMAVLFGVFDSRLLKNPIIRISTVILVVLICASTVLIKQHAVIDVAAGLILSGLVYLLIYFPRYMPKRMKRRLIRINNKYGRSHSRYLKIRLYFIENLMKLN